MLQALMYQWLVACVMTESFVLAARLIDSLIHRQLHPRNIGDGNLRRLALCGENQRNQKLMLSTLL
jgi:hypothetical protein